MTALPITHFSDVLCVWAYIGQLRVDAVERTFGSQVRLRFRFCSVFGDAHHKIRMAWAQKGGFEGFNAHLRQAASDFPEIKLHPDLWLNVRPASSMSPHLFLSAVALAEAAGEAPSGAAEATAKAVRAAFFGDARDVARRAVLADIGAEGGLDVDRVNARIEDGSAFAALAADYHEAETNGIKGSPTWVLNDGRQNLYGNVGYRVIDANIRELLRSPTPDQASWC